MASVARIAGQIPGTRPLVSSKAIKVGGAWVADGREGSDVGVARRCPGPTRTVGVDSNHRQISGIHDGLD